MKTLIVLMFLMFSTANFASVQTDATDAVSNAGTMIDILNSVFTTKSYTAFSAIPTSGQTTLNINIKGSWLGGTDGVDDKLTSFTVKFDVSPVEIPAGFPNAGSFYSNRITLYANNNNVALSCASGNACIVIDFDSSLKRGHLIQTANAVGTAPLQDADGVSYFSSLFEVFYDKSTSVNYLESKMLDTDVTTGSSYTFSSISNRNPVIVSASNPALNFTDFSYDLNNGSGNGVLDNLFGLQ